MTKYKCDFEVVDDGLIRSGYVYSHSVADLLSGFWVNEDGDYTQCDDALYFIPPSCITLITKVKQ